MESTVGDSTPIPEKKKDDSADVARALAMAKAVYTHGDRASALKWLRRAAEAASEEQADTRALELAKAAADFASANRNDNAPDERTSSKIAPSSSPASRSS